MKILYLITKSSPGGAQRYVYDLALCAQAQGHEVVVAAGAGGPLLAQLQAQHIQTHTLFAAQRDIHLFKEVRLFFELFSLLNREKPQVLHVNSGKLGGLGAFAGRLYGVPRIIFTAHGWSFHEKHRSSLSRALIYLFSWLTSFFAHLTITISHYDLVAGNRFMLLKEKMRYIPLGTAVPKTHPRDEARNMLTAAYQENEQWIGMIGELTHNKDYETALSAFAKVLKTLPNTKLIIIGDGELKEELHARARELRIEHAVCFTGFLQDAARYLPAFDCFLLTSQKEGLPYVLLEAGMCKVPVVSSRVGGTPDIILEGHGLLVAPGDVEGFSLALIQCLTNTERAQTQARALQEKIHERFSLFRMCTETLALYSKNGPQ